MFVRAYLRASTKEQDAERAKQSLIDFAASKGSKIASFHVENESGRKLHRPVLMQLIEDADEGDIILTESTDRLTRLTAEDWDKLKLLINSKGLNIVIMDLPTSHVALTGGTTDAMTDGIMRAVNNMLINIHFINSASKKLSIA